MLSGEDWSNWNIIASFVIDIPIGITFIYFRKKKGLDYLDPNPIMVLFVIIFLTVNIFPLWLTNMDLKGKLMITAGTICFLPIAYIGLKRFFKLVKKVNNKK
jgi:hypothetical protein